LPGGGGGRRRIARPSRPPPPPSSQVTCRSALKLVHAPTSLKLHSHPVAYGSGSGQQSVTAVPFPSDPGSLWTVWGSSSAPCAQGTPLAHGSIIRLHHESTGRWLHSHHFPSPLTRAQEVSAFGSDDVSDHLDEWAVEVVEGGAGKGGKGAPWLVDADVRLRHVETGVFLAASPNRADGHPIAGHHEVSGAKKADGGCSWRAADGVYMRGRAEA